MFRLRKFDFSDQDYTMMKRVNRLAWPDESFTIEQRRYEDQSILENKRYWERLVIEKNGKPVGVGEYGKPWWMNVPQTYYVTVMVHPDEQNQGAGSLFYDHALKTMQAEHDVGSVSTDTREDMPNAVQFLTNRGFVPYARYPRSALQVRTFDAAPYAGVAEKMRTLGIEIVPLSELLVSDPECKHKMWKLNSIVAEDEPSPDAITIRPFDEYVKDTLEEPKFSAESWFIAVDNGHYAGFSLLYHHANHPQVLEQGWTGVDRPYRRKGIATALKLQTIAYAQQQPAVELIETDNFETNPMYDINMGLGFRPIPAWVGLRKQISPTP